MMDKDRFEKPTNLIRNILTLLQNEKLTVNELSKRMDMEEDEVREVLKILEKMGLTETIVRPTDLANNTLKLHDQ